MITSLAGASILKLSLIIVIGLFVGIATIAGWIKKRNEAHEKAKKDIDNAIDNDDWNSLDDARRRL